jgi:hypothetical protein
MLAYIAPCQVLGGCGFGLILPASSRWWQTLQHTVKLL